MISFKTIDDDYTEVKFPSNEEALKVVKSAPVHRWDPDRKVWTVETSWVELLCKRFTEKGFDCSINGKLWSPPDVKVLSFSYWGVVPGVARPPSPSCLFGTG